MTKLRSKGCRWREGEHTQCNGLGRERGPPLSPSPLLGTHSEASIQTGLQMVSWGRAAPATGVSCLTSELFFKEREATLFKQLSLYVR